MYIPGEESSQEALVEDDQQSVDSTGDRKKSFSTFGKESEEDCGMGGSLLSEMSSVFQRLLPPSLDTYGECNEMAERTIAMENHRGFLPGKLSSSSSTYPQGVAAWAANTHFQNPSNTSANHVATPTHGPTNHVTATTQTHLKWLPAMEEIPENYEEDELDSMLGHLQGKRSDSRHEVTMDAGELVAEINKLLVDVRQS